MKSLLIYNNNTILSYSINELITYGLFDEYHNITNFNNISYSAINHYLIDFSIDIFSENTQLSTLYDFLKITNIVLDELYKYKLNYTLIIPYNTDFTDFSMKLKQKLMNDFINLAINFYKSNIIRIPLLISSENITNSNNPIYKMIANCNEKKFIKINYSEKSLENYIFIKDFINIIGNIDFKKDNFNIKGQNIFLKEAYEKICIINGDYPLQFNNYQSYKILEEKENIGEINYYFEDILINILSK